MGPSNRLALAALATFGASCSVLAGYRAPVPEVGVDACGNLVDDDFDGALDCDDVDCNGLCSEEHAESCADDRDNDGDGLTDGSDPRCWRFSPPTVQSCATVRGSSLAPAIDPGSLEWRGVGRIVPDPTGGAGYVLAGESSILRVAPTSVATGALDGTTVEARLRLASGVATMLSIVPEGQVDDLATASRFSRFVRLYMGEEWWIGTDDRRSVAQRPFPDPSAPIWVDVRIVFRGRTAAAAFDYGSGALELGQVELPADMEDPIALDVVVQTDGSHATDEAPLVGSLRVVREELSRCRGEEHVPQMRTPPYDIVLAAARGGEDGSIGCALSSAEGTGLSWRSIAGAPWESSFAIGWIDVRYVIGAGITWDAANRRFVGLVATGNSWVAPLGPAAFAAIESPDCDSWALQRVPPTMLPREDLEIVGAGMEYEIEPDGAHVVRFAGVVAGESGLVTLRSTTGDPIDFGFDTAIVPFGADVDAFLSQSALLGIERVGPSDLVLFGASGRGLVAFVPRGSAGGGWTALRAPIFEGTPATGAFDSGVLVGPPRFATSGGDPLHGDLFYGGSGACTDCIQGGVAELTAAP
jgi:hypothetical protein